ncbi:hypothetical protein EDB83DRAFT_1627734 [Lactarius deliciosus]|nr:hypothetical protein EDB83DRAFT_1627734 [Lactarius deliciosus]
MTITVCPVALMGMARMGKCWDAQCHLRHDVVHCEPCKCFVLHGELAKHRRGQYHRLKCGFRGWKARTRRPARAILPSPYHYVPAPKPSNKHARKLARKEELASTGMVPARGVEAQHLSVSGEEGLDFKSEVGVGIDKKTIPVIIQKMADNVSLTLVDVAVTGAGSRGKSPDEDKGEEAAGDTHVVCAHSTRRLGCPTCVALPSRFIGETHHIGGYAQITRSGHIYGR